MPSKPHHLALITIGQSPRHDYTPDLPSLLPPNTRTTQHGALDALSLPAVRTHLSPSPSPTDSAAPSVLVSRMRTGHPVTLDAAKLAPLLTACIRSAAEEKPDAILVLCTGDVEVPPPEELGSVPVVVPREEVRKWFAERGGGGVVVVVSPEERQREGARRRLEEGGVGVVGTGWVNPYGEGVGEGVGRWVRGLGVEAGTVVYLDCMGFTLEQKRVVEGVVGAGVEVVLPREVAFGAVGRLFAAAGEEEEG